MGLMMREGEPASAINELFDLLGGSRVSAEVGSSSNNTSRIHRKHWADTATDHQR